MPPLRDIGEILMASEGNLLLSRQARFPDRSVKGRPGWEVGPETGHHSSDETSPSRIANLVRSAIECSPSFSMMC